MKKAVILIHGYATDKTDFAPLIPYLEGIYDYVCARNIQGHGLDTKDHLLNFNAIDTIKNVDSWAEEMFAKYDRVDIVGFSMGGALSTYLATKYKFGKVVLLAPANKYINGAVGFSRTKLYFDYLKTRISGKETKNVDVHKEVIEDDKIGMDMAVKKLIPSYTPKSLLQFTQVIEYCNYKLMNGKIESPTLILYGTIDQLVPKSSVKFVKKYAKNAKIIELNGISHLMFNSTNVRELTETVLNFLCKDDLDE